MGAVRLARCPHHDHDQGPEERRGCALERTGLHPPDVEAFGAAGGQPRKRQDPGTTRSQRTFPEVG
jgi:hypothetical protein